MEKVAKVTSWWSSRAQDGIKTAFEWLGKKIYNKPWLFIIIGLLLSFVSGLGLLTMKAENRSLYTWIPRDSTIWSQYQFALDKFGSYPSFMSLFVSAYDNNMLSTKYLNQTYKNIFWVPYDLELKWNLNDNNYYYDYDDICLRSYPSAPRCISDYTNIYGYIFNLDKTLWKTQDSIEYYINRDGADIQLFAAGFE